METVLYEVADGIATITLNRPDVLNSMNPQLVADITDAFDQAGADDDVGAIVMTGTGRGFCAGADLNATSDRPAGLSTGQGVAHSMETSFNPMVRKIVGSPKPTLCAVNGVAAGGGVGLALCCDIVLAGKSASFVQVFGPQLGLIPDIACTYFLPRLIGTARARALAFTGEKLSAEKAADWGLIYACVEDDALMTTTMGIATKLANGPTPTFPVIRQAFADAELNTIDAQLDYERDTQGKLGDHPNFSEGVKAFLQKRPPQFSRR